jgi:hypothetical protein
MGLSAGSDIKVFRFFFLSNACAGNIKEVKATNSKRSTKQEVEPSLPSA